MHWRWFIFDYVDPQLGLTRSERRKVREGIRSPGDSWNRMRRSPKHVLLLSLVPVVGMLMAILPFMMNRRVGWYVVPLIWLTQIIVTWTALAIIGHRAYRPMLIEELRRLGYHICAHCGYDLRELPSATDRCPECGSALTST